MDKLGFVYFGIAAAFALFGAISAVSSPNPIRGAMGLLVMIFSIAGLYLALNAQFLATVQVIVYAGAVVVLFVFVIMLLGPGSVSPPDSRGKLTRYAGSALFLGVGTSALFMLVRAMPTPKPMAAAPANFGSIDGFATELFTDGIVPFELASALLLVAIVGAVAVARGKHGELAEKVIAKTGRAPSPSPGGSQTPLTQPSSITTELR